MLKHPNNKKSMSEVLGNWFSTFSESFNAIKVGRIEAVDFTHQTVDVSILHKRRNYPLPNKEVLEDYPLLKAVPFVVLCGGNSCLTFPISVGDNCLLLFCDYEIDRWWDTGENLPANYERKHDISDAFALVGVHSMVDLLTGYSQYVQLKYSGSSNITVGDTIDINNAQTNVSGKLDVVGDITGNAKATAELHSTNGVTTTFQTIAGYTVTVTDGIITSVVK